MKKIISITIIICCILLTGCNPVARKMGGDITVHLKPGEKLVNVTWKESSLWFLTRPMRANDTEETYKFKEDTMELVYVSMTKKPGSKDIKCIIY